MSQILARSIGGGQGLPELGDPLLEEYLQFVAARASRNTVLAQAFDLS